MIVYSIAAASRAACVTRTVVSTEDEEIAAVARRFGADVPFLRPPDLAGDRVPDLPVLANVLEGLAEREGYRPDVLVQLRPTSPARPVTLIDMAVELLVAHPEADSVRAVVPAAQNPHKMWRIDGSSGLMRPLLEVPGVAEPYNAPRQDLPLVYWQTGQIDAVRPEVVLERRSSSGSAILPMVVDSRFAVDIDSDWDLRRAEWLVRRGGLEMVRPAGAPRAWPPTVRLLVSDFDGVLTDNRVWIDDAGVEHVAASRADGLGLARLSGLGIATLVLSSETSPVVAARCRKLGVAWRQGLGDKAEALRRFLGENAIDPRTVVYVGNDINDVACFPVVGFAVAVSDAHPAVLRAADHVLDLPGGRGAVRELCDLLEQRIGGGTA